MAFVAYAEAPLTREQRAERAQAAIGTQFSDKQLAFLTFVLAHYVTSGVDELDEAKLGPLLKLKYNNSIADAFADLGSPDQVRNAFVVFQRHLYEQPFHKLSQ
ncbi:type I restriction-modification enzyme R subunit C-terminal domain-containing protein [Nitrosomonas sp.]|uniref:type I restriction-modification enzyme R subunit C-terminal domain-containing protein n=1 Tax=Nitrosomonas sp. TaxID=42353 RepID=UPI0025D287AB|nr:type I restriction-modification enzyme R subunit C-terminal domain-containing protein [Nitrosomonas sp.]